MKKNLVSAIIITLIIAFFLPGCFEPEHLQEGRHHSKGYNHRHHTEDGGDRGDRK